MTHAPWLLISLALAARSPSYAGDAPFIDVPFLNYSSGKKLRNAPVTHANEVYEGMREIRRKILSICPPSECSYVGIGQSPAYVIADLQEYLSTHGGDPSAALNFPLSGLSQWINLDNYKAFLRKHFDHFLGRTMKSPKAKVLFIDYLDSGRSAVQSGKLIHWYFDQLGTPTVPELLVLRKAAALDFGTPIPARMDRVISQETGVKAHEFELTSRLWHLFQARSFSNFSEYGRFEFREWDSDVFNVSRPLDPSTYQPPVARVDGEYSRLRTVIRDLQLKDSHSGTDHCESLKNAYEQKLNAKLP